MAKARTTISANGGEPIDMDEAMAKMKRLSSHSNRYDIRKAKLKDSNFLETEYSESLSDGTNTVKKDCAAAVHQDMKDAFARMDQMLRDICEQPENSKVTCTGFTVGGKGDGATLIGLRKLESGAVLNLVAPYVKFEDDGDLEHAITTCKQEVLLYLFEGKQAPDAQLGLFDAEGMGEEEEMLEEME